ncbi:hydrogenase nickel incorporation protein HypB [Carboxydochorda subterranea]|uniref:Hydrogenase nickel incorporation protein HypB n=1 Tax=Carboxydichorda subterranea TaxID=3109565 RepID=A0ABZ1BUR6_9FIRM|nr:hydrogenase nickel incorporation protein HypB [Limnochorda sp. L945t]WRP16519.1 hydrogenase nickel incorporation protein HypB [Limnochorda sp. L945t]
MTQPTEPVRSRVLSRNDELAAALRSRWQRRGVFCLNLVSSPGAGKTTLLERTLERLSGRVKAGVLVGDLATERDAERLSRFGFPVRQIVTGGVCHLDAAMVTAHLEAVDRPDLELLFLENVGNLVCPASYDLGQDVSAVLLSTTEGDDKPLKYPTIFRRSGVMVVTKMDLLGASDFDVDRAVGHARGIQPGLRVFFTSCRTGAGIDEWTHWILQQVEAKRAATEEVAAGVPGRAGAD